MSIVRQWRLKGDKLDWSWEARNGEMILVVRKKLKAAASS